MHSRTLATLSLLAASLLLLIRVTTPNGLRLLDFSIEDAAATAWTQGHDPYNQSQLDALWRAKGHVTSGPQTVLNLPSVLPPTTLLVMSPFTPLPPKIAGELWLTASLALLICATLASADLVGLPLNSTPTLFLLAITLALGPTQTGLRVGQPAVPSASLAILAVWSLSKNRPLLTTLLLATALALKPQLPIAILAVYCFRQQWRPATLTLLFLSLITILSIARLQLPGSPWRTSWTQNVQSSLQPGGPNDFMTSPTRDHMINLQAALQPLTHNRTAATAGAWLTALTLTAAWIYITRKSPRKLDPLAIATACAISFIPIYHRYYDLILLLPALAWSIAHVHGAHRNYARTFLLLCIPLLAPVGWQTTLLNKGLLPRSLPTSPLWPTLILPAYAWLLPLLCLTLLAALSAESRHSERSEDSKPLVV